MFAASVVRVIVPQHAHAVGGDPSHYTFIKTQPGSSEPVTWDPCQTIHVVINQSRAIPGGDVLIAGAVHRAASATGLHMVLDGDTDETNLYSDGGGSGAKSDEILVEWTDHDHVERLGDEAVGLGGSVAVRTGSGYEWAAGEIALDAPYLAGMLDHHDGAAEARAVVMHELGHALGLNHVHDRSQIMNPAAGGVTAWGAGDLAGLRRLGGTCRE